MRDDLLIELILYQWFTLKFCKYNLILNISKTKIAFVENGMVKSHSQIFQFQKPDDVDVIVVEAEFLNASGEIFEVAVTFILQQVASGILNKTGENIYEFLKKLILTCWV